MSQPQTRQFPGYGIISPDGVTGIKVVKTFTQGPSKTVNPDGSVSYSTPPPTIHELFGGGFCYANGSPVTNREHLELISDPKMRERAIQWYETHGKAIAPSDIVIKEGESERPEPAFILSNQLPIEEEHEVVKVVEEREKNQDESPQTIAELKEIIQKQSEQIAKLLTPAKMEGDKKLSKQSEIMKAKWADPEWRKNRKNRKKGKIESEINNGTSKTDQKV